MLVVETRLPVEDVIKTLREVCNKFENTPVELKCRISGLKLLGFANRWGPTTVLQFFPEEAVSEGEYSVDVAERCLRERREEVESALRLIAKRLDASFAAVSPYPLSFFAADFEQTLQERMLENPCAALPVLLRRGAPSMLAYALLSLLNAREKVEELVRLLDLDYEHLQRFQMQVRCVEGERSCTAVTDTQLAEELVKICDGQIEVIT